jgi:precorrin-6B methylase 2
MRSMKKVVLAGSVIGIALVVALASAGRWPAWGQDVAPKGQKAPDVIFVPTPQEVVDAMLKLADIHPGDVLYDLGCGDGRIVVTAAKTYGVKAVGFDVDPKRIKESRENVRKSGVGDKVTITQADIFEQDLREANVVTLYLLPSLNVRLMPQLARLKPGSRIVSHSFDMKGAKPKEVVHVKLRTGGERTVYLWVVPWEKE